MYNAKPLTLKHQGLLGRWINFRGRNTWPEVNYRGFKLQPLAPAPTPALTPAVVFSEDLSN